MVSDAVHCDNEKKAGKKKIRDYKEEQTASETAMRQKRTESEHYRKREYERNYFEGQLIEAK
jgi:hypothetical protein